MKGVSRFILLAGLIAAASFAVAACGDDSSGSGSGASGGEAVSVAPPKSGCGSFTSAPPKDPDGIVAELPQDLKENYEGYPDTVEESVWKDWKPNGDPPYKVGISWATLINDFQLNITKGLRDTLKKNPDVGEIDFKSTGTNLDVTQQLQQLQAIIRSKPDLIILEQLQPNAYVDALNQAGKMGIPVIVVVDTIDSKYGVTVNYNTVTVPAQVASIAARIMGGKGNLVYNRGIPGVGVDTLGVQGFDSVLKNCPDIKKIGDVYANFVVANAKSEHLKFLATHPQQIDGVWTVAGTGQGIFGAFEQAGRPAPVLADVGSSRGSLGYWLEHNDSYQGAAGVVPEISIGLRIGDIANKMLAGDGVKYSQIVGNMPIVTDENIKEFAEEGWKLTTPGDSPGPANGFMTSEQVDAFFSK